MNFIRNFINFGKHKEETDDHEKMHPPKPTPSRLRAAPPHNSPHHPPSQSALAPSVSAPNTSIAPQTSLSKEKVVRKSRQREIRKEEPKETKKEDQQTPKTITEDTKTKSQCENEKKSEAPLPKRPTKAKATVNSEEAHTDFETVAAPSRPAISRSATRDKKRFSRLMPASPEGKDQRNSAEEKKERTEDTGATQEQTETTGGTSAEK